MRVVLGLMVGLLVAVPPSSQGASAARLAGSGLEERIPLGDRAIAFEGFVYTPAGAPAEGAVVVTSAGGQAMVDPTGRYRLEARVPWDAEIVQVTAVGQGGNNLAATARIDVSSGPGRVLVGPLSLAEGSSCSPSWLPTFGGAPGVFGSVFAFGRL